MRKTGKRLFCCDSNDITLQGFDTVLQGQQCWIEGLSNTNLKAAFSWSMIKQEGEAVGHFEALRCL